MPRKSFAEQKAEEDEPKGLKFLTVQVMKIVQEQRVSTYSEIADLISADEKQNLPGGSQENKKRRVYDVLNVLIAMGLLRKDKKAIIWAGDPQNDRNAIPSTTTTTTKAEGAAAAGQKSSSVPNHAGSATFAPDQKNLVAQDIQSLTETVSFKRQELSGLLVHHLLLSELAKHNAAKEQQRKEEGKEISDERKISLPFIVLSAAKGTPIDVQLGTDKTTAAVTFKGQFHVHDDLEVLTKMDLLSKVTPESMKELISEELWSLLPQSLIKHLNEPVFRSKGADRVSVTSSTTRAAPSPTAAATTESAHQSAEKRLKRDNAR